jgi:hypothetical protein
MKRWFSILVLCILSSCGEQVKIDDKVMNLYKDAIESGNVKALPLEPMKMDIDYELYHYRVKLFGFTTVSGGSGNIQYNSTGGISSFNPGSSSHVDINPASTGVYIGNGVFIDVMFNVSFCPLKYFGESRMDYRIMKNGQKWLTKKGRIVTILNNPLFANEVSYKDGYVENMQQDLVGVTVFPEMLVKKENRIESLGMYRNDRNCIYETVNGAFIQTEGPKMRYPISNVILQRIADNEIDSSADMFGQKISVKQNPDSIQFTFKIDYVTQGDWLRGKRNRVCTLKKMETGFIFIDDEKNGVIIDLSGDSVVVFKVEGGRMSYQNSYQVLSE